MAILLREQEQLIAMKVESTYGVDSSPAGANALMAQDITIRELEGDVAQRNNYRGFLGAQGSIRLNTYVAVEFYMELSGSGVADTAPYYNGVFLATGHAEVITAATKVDYSPVSENLDSFSLYYQKGEHRHACLGVRGSLELEMGTKQLPRLKFTGFGLYVAPVKTALAGVDFSGIRKPLKWTKETVSTLTMHGVTLNGAMFTFSQGHSPEFLALTGEEEIICPARDSKITVKFREDDVSVQNWYEEVRANAAGAFAMQHGVDVTNEGDIFEFNAANAELDSLQSSFEQGISYLTAGLSLVPTSKNSEYSFTRR